MDTQLQRQEQAEASPAALPNSTLWSRSRPWRALVTTSCVLTALAVSAPMVLPQLTDSLVQESCKLQADAVPRHAVARVVAFVPQDQVVATTRNVEAQIGGKISPGYLSLRRIGAVGIQPNSRFSTMAAIPDNVVLKVGDVVDLSSRYRDPNLPCNFIPWMVTRVVTASATTPSTTSKPDADGN